MATVCNIVATAKISLKRIDLFKISKTCQITFDPKHFNALIIKIETPRATGLLFASGKCVSIGAKNINNVKLSFEKIAELIHMCGYDVKITHFHIHNVVGSASLNYKLNMCYLKTVFKGLLIYEPEIFPGAKLKLPHSKATALLFTTGKVIITGCKKESEMNIFYRKLTSLFNSMQI